MNPIHILALDTMIEIAPEKSQKMTIGLVFDMLVNLDIEMYAKMTSGQRRNYLRSYFM